MTSYLQGHEPVIDVAGPRQLSLGTRHSWRADADRQRRVGIISRMARCS